MAGHFAFGLLACLLVLLLAWRQWRKPTHWPTPLSTTDADLDHERPSGHAHDDDGVEDEPDAEAPYLGNGRQHRIRSQQDDRKEVQPPARTMGVAAELD